jgi:signal transduction histidine kinase
MASSPNELVDTLLRMALELCTAGSAGLSLLETTPTGEQIFRWTNVAGALSKHVGGSTPRNFRPYGVTLDRNASQLFVDPGRRFQYFNGIDLRFAEALVIPVYLGGETPGTIWIVAHDDEVKFDSEDARIMAGLAEFTGSALRLMRLTEMQQRARLEGDREIAAHKRTEQTLLETQAGLEAAIHARTAQLQQLSVNLITLQDEERRRLARELHDSAGQYLAGIQMNLGALLRSSPNLKASEQIRVTDSMAMAEHCISEIRTMSYLLHPPLLDEMGLKSAISWYAEGFAERSGIRVDLEMSEDIGRLPSEIETALFRVVQQSLANIHRHSGSKVALIQLNSNAASVTVTICDQGCGIRSEVLEGLRAGKALEGVGMAGMRERVGNMRGHFEVRSSEKGTTIEVIVPLPVQVAASV